jgi:integrase
VKGHTYKRCPCGTLRDADGRRINCPKRHGTWSFVHELPPGPDGSRRQSSRGGFATQAQARDALNQELGKLRRGTYVERSQATVSEYLDQWLAAKVTLRDTTRKAYRDHITLYLKPGLGHLRLQDCRDTDIETLYAAMRLLGTDDADPSDWLVRRLVEVRRYSTIKPLSDASMHRVHATLMSALNTAVKRKRLDANPAEHVEVPSGRRPRAVVWTDARVAHWRATGERPAVAVWTAKQTGAFLDAAARHRLYPIYHLIAYRGLRRGEAVGAARDGVDLEEGSLRISQTLVQLGWEVRKSTPKTDGSERTVSLDAGSVTVLRRWLATQAADRLAIGAGWHDTGLLFTREDGSAIHPDLVTDTFHRIVEAADLPPIRLHDLRHTAASLALQANVPLKVVSELLGHSGVAITADTYTSVFPEVAAAAAEAVAEVVPRSTQETAVGSPATTPLAVRSQNSGFVSPAEPSKIAEGGKNMQVRRMGGPREDRTHNPRIKSPLLCRLS